MIEVINKMGQIDGLKVTAVNETSVTVQNLLTGLTIVIVMGSASYTIYATEIYPVILLLDVVAKVKELFGL